MIEIGTDFRGEISQRIDLGDQKWSLPHPLTKMCILSFFMLSIPPIRPMPASIQQSSAFIPSSPLLSVFRPTSYSLLSTSLTSSPHLPLKRSRISLPPTTTCTNLPPSPPPPTKSSSAPSFRAIRKLLAALSFIGCLETSYLTFNKLFSSPGTICATQGCLDVLSGPFSSFLGIPLTLFGLLAYAIFAYLCVWPLAADEEEDQNGFLLSVEQVYDARDAATRPLLLALSTSLVVFSGFLMSLLAFVIRSTCPYCFFSAALSAVIFTLTAFVGRAVPKLGDAIRVGTASTALTSLLAAVFFLMSYPVHINAQPPGEPQAPPDITMKSTSDTLVRDAFAKFVSCSRVDACFICLGLH